MLASALARSANPDLSGQYMPVPKYHSDRLLSKAEQPHATQALAGQFYPAQDNDHAKFMIKH